MHVFDGKVAVKTIMATTEPACKWTRTLHMNEWLGRQPGGSSIIEAKLRFKEAGSNKSGCKIVSLHFFLFVFLNNATKNCVTAPE